MFLARLSGDTLAELPWIFRLLLESKSTSTRQPHCYQPGHTARFCMDDGKGEGSMPHNPGDALFSVCPSSGSSGPCFHLLPPRTIIVLTLIPDP